MPAVQRASPSRPTAPDISHAIPVDSTNRPLPTTEKANSPPTTAANLPPQKPVHTDPSAKGAISDNTPKTILLTKTSSTLSASRSSIPSTPSQSSPLDIKVHAPTTKATIVRSSSQPLSPSRTASIQRQFGTSAEPPAVTNSYIHTMPPSLYSKQSEIHNHNPTDINLTNTQTKSQPLPILSASPSGNRSHGSSIIQHSLPMSSHSSGISDASTAASKSSNPPNVLIGITKSNPAITAGFGASNSSILGSSDAIGNSRGNKHLSPVSRPPPTSTSPSEVGNSATKKTVSHSHTTTGSGRTTPTAGKQTSRPVALPPQSHHASDVNTSNSTTSGSHADASSGRTGKGSSARPVTTSANSQKSTSVASPPQGHYTSDSHHASDSNTAKSTNSSSRTNTSSGRTGKGSSASPVTTSTKNQKSTPVASNPQGHHDGNSTTTSRTISSSHTSTNAGKATKATPVEPVSNPAKSQKSTPVASNSQGHHDGNSTTTSRTTSSSHTGTNAGKPIKATPVAPVSTTAKSQKSTPVASKPQNHHESDPTTTSPTTPGSHTNNNAGKTTKTTSIGPVPTSAKTSNLASTSQRPNSTPPARINLQHQSHPSPSTTPPTNTGSGAKSLPSHQAPQQEPSNTRKTTPSTIITFSQEVAATSADLDTSTNNTPTLSFYLESLTPAPSLPTMPSGAMVAVVTDSQSHSVTGRTGYGMALGNVDPGDQNSGTTTFTASTSGRGPQGPKNTGPSEPTALTPSSSSFPFLNPTDHGKNKNNHTDGSSTGEKEAIIAGSVAAAVSIVTLILVLVALLICRRKQRRQRVLYQQQPPGNMVSVLGMSGISYVPAFPVSAAPPYQQAIPPLNQKAELEFSSAKPHPSFVPAYGDATQSVDGTIFQNMTPIDNLKPASYLYGQGRIYSSHRNQHSATSNDIEYTLEERPSSGHVQEHVATESMVQPQRIKSVTSDNSVQFGVAL